MERINWIFSTFLFPLYKKAQSELSQSWLGSLYLLAYVHDYFDVFLCLQQLMPLLYLECHHSIRKKYHPEKWKQEVKNYYQNMNKFSTSVHIFWVHLGMYKSCYVLYTICKHSAYKNVYKLNNDKITFRLLSSVNKSLLYIESYVLLQKYSMYIMCKHILIIYEPT